MLNNPNHITARRLLMDAVSTVGTEKLVLSASGGRILAQDLVAAENIPLFDCSPYDGYAEGSPCTGVNHRKGICQGEKVLYEAHGRRYHISPLKIVHKVNSVSFRLF